MSENIMNMANMASDGLIHVSAILTVKADGLTIADASQVAKEVHRVINAIARLHDVLEIAYKRASSPYPYTETPIE